MQANEYVGRRPDEGGKKFVAGQIPRLYPSITYLLKYLGT